MFNLDYFFKNTGLLAVAIVLIILVVAIETYYPSGIVGLYYLIGG